MVWVKCTTSAECKTIRIAVSAVMDARPDLSRRSTRSTIIMMIMMDELML